jgi:hypothetical protein
MDQHPAGFPEDWGKGWCCRACAVRAWYSLGETLRREILEVRA